jgi:hypothetical protein
MLYVQLATGGQDLKGEEKLRHRRKEEGRHRPPGRRGGAGPAVGHGGEEEVAARDGE